MRGEVSNLNESEINDDSGNLKGKCVESRTTLISGRWQKLAEKLIENVSSSKMYFFSILKS
jgi:hypothetical protein